MTLRPCPFCGGEGSSASQGPEFNYIFCERCFYRTPRHDSREEAAKFWNTRELVVENEQVRNNPKSQVRNNPKTIKIIRWVMTHTFWSEK